MFHPSTAALLQHIQQHFCQAPFSFRAAIAPGESPKVWREFFFPWWGSCSEGVEINRREFGWALGRCDPNLRNMRNIVHLLRPQQSHWHGSAWLHMSRSGLLIGMPMGTGSGSSSICGTLSQHLCVGHFYVDGTHIYEHNSKPEVVFVASQIHVLCVSNLQRTKRRIRLTQLARTKYFCLFLSRPATRKASREVLSSCKVSCACKVSHHVKNLTWRKG